MANHTSHCLTLCPVRRGFMAGKMRVVTVQIHSPSSYICSFPSSCPKFKELHFMPPYILTVHKTSQSGYSVIPAAFGRLTAKTLGQQGQGRSNCHGKVKLGFLCYVGERKMASVALLLL